MSETVKVAAGVAQRPVVQLSTHEPSGSGVLLTEHEARLLATAILAAAARLGEVAGAQR